MTRFLTQRTQRFSQRDAKKPSFATLAENFAFFAFKSLS